MDMDIGAVVYIKLYKPLRLLCRFLLVHVHCTCMCTCTVEAIENSFSFSFSLSLCSVVLYARDFFMYDAETIILYTNNSPSLCILHEISHELLMNTR